jgi:hypothetical protein
MSWPAADLPAVAQDLLIGSARDNPHEIMIADEC